MIRLLAFDVDGTLCHEKNEISKPLKSVLTILQEQGMEMILATGRPLVDLNAFQQKNNFYTPAVLLNGAAILQKDDSITDCVFLDEKDSSYLISLLRQKGYPFVCYMESKMIEFFGSKKRYAQIMGSHLNHEPELQTLFDSFELYDPMSFQMDRILKIEICFEDIRKIPDVKEMILNHVNLHAVSSMGFNLEITSLLANKGKKLKSYVQSQNIKEDEVMVFGDGENDISMFEQFKHSVLIENKNHPFDYPTQYRLSSKEGALAEFLKNYFQIKEA